MRDRAPAHRAERQWQARARIGGLAVAVVLCGGGVAASCARLAATPGYRPGWSLTHTLLLVFTTLLLVFALALVVEVDRSWTTLTRMHRAAELELSRRLTDTARALTSKERALAAKERALADQHSHVEALRAERDFTAAVLDKAVALVVVYDHDGRIIGFNSACEQLTGYSEEEVTGRGFWEVLFASEFTPRFAAELERLKSDPTPATVEVAWTGRRDERRIAFTTTVLHDRHGKVTFYVASGTDVTEQRSREARLRRLADTDPLTGLLNRTAFRRELEGALDRRAGSGAALLFCDLDDFKAINDTMGHAAGDELLVSVANRLREAVRLRDVVARLGGDEFVILCPGLGAEDTGRLALRVGETVERPYRLEAGEVLVGVSVGTALATVGVDPDTALDLADHSMYRAKASRRALAAH